MADPVQMTALQNLAKALPVANSRIANNVASAQNMQVQKAVQAAPVAAPIASSAADTGAGVASNTGAAQIDTTKQQLNQANQINQVGQQETATANSNVLASQQQGAKQDASDQAAAFGKLNEGLKKTMYDDQMKFQTDEQGRTQFNATQLADYARLNAQNDQDYQNYAQAANQVESRKLQMLEQANKLIMEDLQSKYEVAKARGDFEVQRATQQAINDQKNEMAKKKAAAGNRAALFTTAGQIVGGVVGAVAGTFVLPGAGTVAGASLGASAGGALGGAAANATN